MQQIDTFNLLKKEFKDIAFIEKENEESHILIKKKQLRDMSIFLKDNGFDMLSLISAVDNIDNFSLFYHFTSIKNKIRLLIKINLEKDKPQVDTICDIYESSNWLERETFDLMGITFLGHPNLTRILLPLDWEGYPLRRDYDIPDMYHGIKKDREF